LLSPFQSTISPPYPRPSGSLQHNKDRSTIQPLDQHNVAAFSILQHNLEWYAICHLMTSSSPINDITVMETLKTDAALNVVTFSNTSWSNEAIIALISLIVMIILSSVSLVCNYGPSIRGRMYVTQWSASISGAYPPSSCKQSNTKHSQKPS
jgi:hypothetical protein